MDVLAFESKCSPDLPRDKLSVVQILLNKLVHQKAEQLPFVRTGFHSPIF